MGSSRTQTIADIVSLDIGMRGEGDIGEAGQSQRKQGCLGALSYVEFWITVWLPVEHGAFDGILDQDIPHF